jgi:hypothetical protein
VCAAAPSLTLAALLAAFGSTSNAQTPDSPLKRSEPHEALAFFEGTWTSPEEAGTEPAKREWQETCAWLDGGRRHIVCTPRWQLASGAFNGLAVYSYDEKSGEYLSYAFKPFGRVTTQRGQRIPRGFRFLSERGTGEERVRERYTLEEGAGGRISTVLETAKGDGPWVIDDKSEVLRMRP